LIDSLNNGELKVTRTNVGKLYVHTPKAVRRGLPGDSVYAVVASKGKYLISWECKWSGTKLKHPAFPGELLETNDERLFIMRDNNYRLWIGGPTADGKGYKTLVKVERVINGIAPSKVFYLDSYYKRLWT
jgi:hypothetical protein